MRSAARVLERVNEEGGGAGSGSSGSETPASAAGGSSSENSRFRPLEDPYLVGEEAAARARRERLARENGDDVLYKEDRRWDWFLCKAFFVPCRRPPPSVVQPTAPPLPPGPSPKPRKSIYDR